MNQVFAQARSSVLLESFVLAASGHRVLVGSTVAIRVRRPASSALQVRGCTPHCRAHL